MIDLSHVPEIPGLSVFLPQGTGTDSWQVWNKPRGFVMVSIYAIGPGGGGGSGASNQATSSPGGGGGGSGGISRLTIPIFMLPDSLYIQVSPGGSGGASATNANGTAGNVAYAPLTTLVSAAPSSTAQYLYLEANAGGGGGAGQNGVVGSAGSAASIASARPFALLGSTLFIAGNAGAAGSTGSGGSITQGTASQIYGGCGGGGGAQNGGVVSALASTPFIAFRASSTVGSPASEGSNGVSWTTIFPGKIYGGHGGAGTTQRAGGNGSAWGAGGGGSGGTITAGTTTGRGGDGGPGAVIIQCW